VQELIGQIAASLIAGTIILILAVVSWRGQHHSTSAVQYSALKEGILDFAEVMEEDISNMGAGLTNNALNAPAGYGAFYSSTAFNTATSPYSFKFYSWTDRTANIDPNPTTPYDSWVEYEWQQTGTVQVKDPTTGNYVTTPTFKIERTVKTAAGSATSSGESIDTVTGIDFEFLNEAGVEVDVEANPALMKNVRAVLVTLTAVSPLGGGKGYLATDDAALKYDVDQSRWSRTIRPPNLNRIPN
jgi:hypothetical protein